MKFKDRLEPLFFIWNDPICWRLSIYLYVHPTFGPHLHIFLPHFARTDTYQVVTFTFSLYVSISFINQNNRIHPAEPPARNR